MIKSVINSINQNSRRSSLRKSLPVGIAGLNIDSNLDHSFGKRRLSKGTKNHKSIGSQSEFQFSFEEIPVKIAVNVAKVQKK